MARGHKNAASMWFLINGSIITAAPSSPPLPSPLTRHAPVCRLCQNLYFGNSTWHRELTPVTLLRAQATGGVHACHLSIWNNNRDDRRALHHSLSAPLHFNGEVSWSCSLLCFCPHFGGGRRFRLRWARTCCLLGVYVQRFVEDRLNRSRGHVKPHCTHLGK